MTSFFDRKSARKGDRIWPFGFTSGNSDTYVRLRSDFICSDEAGYNV
jgi:hypothetical protein